MTIQFIFRDSAQMINPKMVILVANGNGQMGSRGRSLPGRTENQKIKVMMIAL